MNTTTAPAQTSAYRERPFVISRVLDAPRELVWKTWRESEHMSWWGPKGVTIEHAKLDLRPGGIFHYAMKTAEGPVMWGRWVIRQMAKPERLVFVNSFSDELGGITRHPMSPHWPLEMFTTVAFVEQDGQTMLTILWLPLNATELERKTFNDGHESMKNGWGGSLDRLEEYLGKIKGAL
jgi:uncharacterized protein YndB with AHSA1/START domain